MERFQPKEIARVCHEANRALRANLGEPAWASWEDTVAEHQESVLDGVNVALTNPALLPEQSHENWLAFKRAAGWEYGPKKSDALRLHPCLVSWSELPVEQRAKDTLFLGIVRAMAAIGEPRWP